MVREVRMKLPMSRAMMAAHCASILFRDAVGDGVKGFSIINTYLVNQLPPRFLFFRSMSIWLGRLSLYYALQSMMVVVVLYSLLAGQSFTRTF